MRLCARVWPALMAVAVLQTAAPAGSFTITDANVAVGGGPGETSQFLVQGLITVSGAQQTQASASFQITDNVAVADPPPVNSGVDEWMLLD